MATISTSQTLDSAARTAGEAFTIDSGATFTIDTDTRYHRNAPAGGTGSLGTLNITRKSTIFVDGTSVRWLPYTGGSGNVPAYNTSIVGNTSGATGALLGVYSAVNAAPTAVGSAMPATGFIKLKSASTAYNASEALTGLTATTNGTDVVGWLEIVMDGSYKYIQSDILSTFKTRSSWFELGTTTGTAGQVVQLPTCGGGTNTHYGGVWIEKSVGSNTYEFYPGQQYVANLATSGWYSTAKGTDSRSKFVEIQDGGAIRIGANVSGNYGYTPVSGLKIRIPNLLFNTTNSTNRAINIVLNLSLSTRSKFYNFYGIADIQGGIFDWYFDLSTLCKTIILKNVVFIDNCAILSSYNPIELENIHNGNYGSHPYDGGIKLNYCSNGGTVKYCKFGRPTDYSTDLFRVNFSKNIIFTENEFQIRNHRSAAQAVPFYSSYSSGLEFYDNLTVGNGLYFLACNDIYVEDAIYLDSYDTTTQNTPDTFCVSFNDGCNNCELSNVSWYTGFSNVHVYDSILYCKNSSNIKFNNLGTRSSPINCGSSNKLKKFFTDSGGCSYLKFKRLYSTECDISTSATSSNVICENLYGSYTQWKYSTSVDGLIKSVTGYGSYYSNAGVGSTFYSVFTSNTAGKVGFNFNIPSTITSPYVDLTGLSSTSTFTGGGSPVFYLGNSGDYIIYESPYWIKGHTAFSNTAPTLSGTSVYSHEIYYQIDTGSGWNGTWKSATGANLSGETISASTGFKLKIKITATATVTTRNFSDFYITTVTSTTAQDNYYPLDTINLTLTGLQTGSDVVIYQAGTTTVRQESNEVSGTTATYTYEASESVDIGVFKAGYVPLYVRAFTLPTSDSSLPIAQVVDRAYLV